MKCCGRRELLGGREPTRKSKIPGKPVRGDVQQKVALTTGV